MGLLDKAEIGHHGSCLCVFGLHVFACFGGVFENRFALNTLGALRVYQNTWVNHFPSY